MLITIRNSTTEPIIAYTDVPHPTPSKFRLSKNRATNASNIASSNEISLIPSLEFTTRLPKGFQREIILRSQNPANNDLRTFNKSNIPLIVGVTEQDELSDDKEWHIHTKGFRISLSMTFASSWQVVAVSDNCPWRVFIRRVCFRL